MSDNEPIPEQESIMAPDKVHACYQQEKLGSLTRICENELPAMNAKLDKIVDLVTALGVKVAVIETDQTNMKSNLPTARKVVTIAGIVGALTGFISTFGKSLFNW